jgi:hypothetical protein
MKLLHHPLIYWSVYELGNEARCLPKGIARDLFAFESLAYMLLYASQVGSMVPSISFVHRSFENHPIHLFMLGSPFSAPAE